MNRRDMASAPQDGSRILLHHHISLYDGGQWQRAGTKWEECFWGVSGWSPWWGDVRTRSSEIRPSEAIEWTPLPPGSEGAIDQLIARANRVGQVFEDPKP